MPDLDMRTSITIFILVNYICTCVLALTWYQSRERHWGTGYFLVEFIVFSVGMTLAIFRQALPALITVVAANVLMFTSTVLLLFGMARFIGLTVRRAPYVIYILLFTLVYAYFTFVSPDVRVRIMLFSGMSVPIFGRAAGLVFFSADPEHRRFATGTGMVMVLFLLLYLFRVYYAYIGTSVASYFNTPMMDAILTIFCQAVTILLVFSLQLMINGKLFHLSRRDAARQEELLEQTRLLATVDSLTCLYNRRKSEELLALEMERFKRYNTPLSVMMCDIDDFKHLNDTYGHDIGDRALVHVAEVLKNNLRATDHVGRWGGEEFLVLFPGLALEEAARAAAKLQRLFSEFQPDFLDSGERVTLSFGLAGFSASLTSLQVLKQADEALYRAKVNGRNRVELQPACEL